MASFSDLIRAQRQSGKGVITSLSGAYNQMNMQKYDPRNALFAKSGVMTALFPGLKGYQASPISSKSPSSLVSQQVGGSPTALSSIARDARISARNSMALPSIARNMAQLVRISGGTPAKYFEKAEQRESAYESKQTNKKESKLSGLGKSITGGAFNILGILGGALGSIGSVAGAILGGIGSLLGGAASGIFGVLSSALGGMGFIGILAAGAIGFLLYQLYQNLDFSSLKGAVTNFTDKLVNGLDSLTGGEFSKTMNDLREGFSDFSIQIASIVQATMTMMSNLVIASVKDIMGRLENFYEDIRLSVTGQSRDTKFGPGGLNVSEMGLTSGRSLDELESKKQQALKMEGEYSFFRKGLKKDPKTGKLGPEWEDQEMRVKWNRVLDKLDENISYVKGKGAVQKERTSNVENTPSLQDLINQRMTENKWRKWSQNSNSPTAASSSDLLDMIGKAEGGKMGYDAANKNTAGDMPQGYPGLSKLTVGQVMQLQANKTIMAAGRYQIIPGTLSDAVKAGVVSVNDIFNSTTQDKLGQYLINKRLEKAGNDPLKQQEELSLEFAAIENPKTGKSSYAGKAGNKASISTASIQSILSGGRSPQLASAPTKAPGTETSKSTMPDVAALVYEQVAALDKLMGGTLKDGSVQYSDMLRDVTREFMNNPTYIDNSQNVMQSQPLQVSSGGTSAWDKDVLNAIGDGRIWNK